MVRVHAEPTKRARTLASFRPGHLLSVDRAPVYTIATRMSKVLVLGQLCPILPSLFLRRRTARETGNIPRRAPFNPVGEHVQSSTRPLPSFPSHPLRPIASSRTSRNSRGTLLPSSAHHTRAVQGERGVRTRHSHLLTAPPPYLTLDGSASRVNKGARLR
jgi:hypothetical protein